MLFSGAMRAQSGVLKRFLSDKLYRHPQVLQNTQRAQQVVRELFGAYLAGEAAMPPSFAQREDQHRAVSDYIAGMTDRFAMREHERLTGQRWIA